MIFIVVVAVIILLGVGGAAVWFVLRRRPRALSRGLAEKSSSSKRLSFRWRYIALPVAILLLSIILTAYFYHLLPGELTYNFKAGSPDKGMSRGAAVAWMLIPQFILTLLAAAIVWGTTKLSTLFRQAASSGVEKVLSIMGNMIALPQIILGFAMVDIFSYNAYQIHLMPLWVFTLMVTGLGTIILGIFFLLAIRRIWGTTQGGTR